MVEEGSGPLHPVLHVYTDGAAGPTNPGPAASAWIIMDPTSGEVLAEDAVYIGRHTNNMAEYTAIIRALEDCRALGSGKVRVHSDSQLCINQINGSWRVNKPYLGSMLAEVRRLRARFEDVRFVWVRRENAWITRCDRNAAEVLASRRGGSGGP
jgi:probable phosphoglycerate mutase